MSILYLKSHHRMAGRLLGALLLCMTSSLSVGSQEITTVKLEKPQLFPVSPQAAIMDRFQSYPMNYCTGVPEISIPLYEIVAGDVTIPVTLSYHASGLKPQEGSGLVGTNWSLSLEPSVSREVRGADDGGMYGWLYEGSYHRGIPGGATRMEQIQFMEDVVNGVRDSQPDKFTYRLPHGGGSGYMLYPSSPMVTCPRTNDVVRWEKNEKMTITDDKGYYYEFNGAVEKIFVSQTVNRWLCTSIRSPHRVTPSVTFSYETMTHILSGVNKGDMGNEEVILSKPESGDVYYLTCHTPNSDKHLEVIPDYVTKPDASFYDYKTTLRDTYGGKVGLEFTSSSSMSQEMNVSRLTDIHFMGNTMNVSYTAVGGPNHYSEVYDRLEVTDEKGKLVRSIRFYLSAFNANTSLTKLDSVSITAPGVEKRVYKFNYNGGPSVPSVNTKEVDHWGFCNGPENKYAHSAIPNFRKVLLLNKYGKNERLLLDYKGTNREANPLWANSGMLIQITDPQGLETHFEYEGNYAAFACDTSDPREEGQKYLRPVGGLRVKTIRTYEPKVQKTIFKRYTYGLERSIGNGVTWGGGAIPHIVTERDYQTNMLQVQKSGYQRALTIFHTMPVSQITFHNGSAVLYSNVREKIEGAGTKQETVYIYHVPFHKHTGILTWDVDDLDYRKKESRVNDFLLTHSFSELQGLVCPLPNNQGKHSDEYSDISDPHWLAGKLARVERYRGSNFILSTTQYEYERADVGSVVSIDIPARHISASTEICLNNPGEYSWSSMFSTGRFYPPQDGGMAQSTFYLHIGSYTFLKGERTDEYRSMSSIMGDEYKTQKAYEHILSYNQGSSLEPRRVTTTRSDGSTVIDEYDYLDGTFPGILSKHRHTEGGNWKESRIVFKPGTSLPDKVVSATDQKPELRDEVVYMEYDNYNNVAEVRGKDGTPTTYLWGYQGRFPVAMIENTTRDQVLAAMGPVTAMKDSLKKWSEASTPPEGMRIAIEKVKTLPNANVYSCEYEPLKGVVAVTDPNNVTTRHEYDGWNRLTGSYYLDASANKVLLQRFLYHFGEK
ncbi:hypothetical protein [Bacteroides sp.]|uniref:hypothetical protein n=1 Tax=Bacteroides sp. TaxID=29523 RepID=UPI002601A887|nr:hypothetical protein [Bacteroides sp.]MDD3036931.1 hypothetical protein [Bacteroides sp.]